MMPVGDIQTKFVFFVAQRLAMYIVSLPGTRPLIQNTPLFRLYSCAIEKDKCGKVTKPGQPVSSPPFQACDEHLPGTFS